MKSAVLLSLAAAAVPAAAVLETFKHGLTARNLLRRDDASCAETYGPGNVQCGTSGDYCYDPSAGESCCLLDEGYCPSGTYCAPFVGYCCYDDQNVDQCAEMNGVTYTGTATVGPSQTGDAVQSGVTSSFAYSSSSFSYSSIDWSSFMSEFSTFSMDFSSSMSMPMSSSAFMPGMPSSTAPGAVPSTSGEPFGSGGASSSAPVLGGGATTSAPVLGGGGSTPTPASTPSTTSVPGDAASLHIGVPAAVLAALAVFVVAL